MSTKTTTQIKMTDMVEVRLDDAGRRAYAIHSENETGHKPSRHHSRLRLGLWEVMRIFGRFAVTSTDLPIDAITVTVDSDVDESRRLARVYLGLLRAIARSVGIATDYDSPEMVEEKVRRYLNADPPPAVPDCPGAWWRNDEVEMVRGDDDVGLFVVLGNGRRKMVADLDGWRGPALRDARVVVPCDPDDAPDIPF
jgi:hypothetical protein